MMKFLGKRKAEFRHKVFCIGFNKTGTTSVEKALTELGYRMGNQTRALGLLTAYKKRDFRKIVDFCHTADAFQDAPFSWPYTFIALDQAFPSASFILTTRHDANTWYNSLVKFHSKLFSDGKNPPSYELMQKAKREDGSNLWDRMSAKFAIEPSNPYEKEKLVAYYENHIQTARDYFRFKDNFIELKIDEIDSYSRMCKFLSVEPLYEQFPWENKT